MANQDQFLVTAMHEYKGVTTNLGVFDTQSGITFDSESNSYWAGGGKRIVSAGRSTPEDLTISRYFDAGRDLPLRTVLKNAGGRGKLTVSVQALDDDENPVGTPTVATGRQRGATILPETDSNSSDTAMMSIVVEVEE